ncbi:hypothetical protein M409DRAFT_67187 [Zasmidium cellare ATCC 36951]|uniref:Cytochrome P450 n=1 Tax=Zasmidium cellare ATCC 36951 TaxID=1080233 RepID=A0A6A6CDL5_ZASCE|nr:uncharacterized protein M409DRAFT_67187 [Zasmidium cellare ATCC 36951]KAF2165317.1 hypothetical protein M409DRAFT_67187 [Zasmidium cellare ATCC 36951]
MLLSYTTAFVFLGVIVAISIVKTLLPTLHNPLNALPGPWHTKLTNLRLKLAVLTGRRIHYIHSLHTKYGPYVRISPTEIAVNDPAGNKHIHGVGSNFEKSAWYNDFTVMDRPTLFTMQERRSHAARRKLFARGFSRSNLKTNWEGVIKEKVELVVRKVQEEAGRQGGKVDLLKWFTLMASDVSSHLMFGESFHTLEQGEVNEFIRVMTLALKGNGIGAELPLVRAVGKWLPFKAVRELWQTNEILDEYARVAVRNMKAAGGGKNIFANMLAESEKGEEGALDDRDVEIEATALFIAGTDTTAVSLTYLIWAVLRKPDLRIQLENEVSTLPEVYTDADTEKLPFLSAVIEETMRLYGAAPGMLPRIVPPGGVDMGGFYIPQGMTVTTHAYSAHRDPEVFPDPLEFNPRRWLGDEAAVASMKAALSGFGSGARSCLGIHLAYTELRLAAAEFFRRCQGSRLAESATPESMEFENFFLIAPRSDRCEIVVA